MKSIVLKFGGSSQCKIGANVIFKKIEQYLCDGYKIFIVISAVGKTTNNLYAVTECDKDKYDLIYETHKKYCEDIDIDFKCIEHLLDDLKNDINDYYTKPFINITEQRLKIISYGEVLASTIVHNFLHINKIDNHFVNAYLFMKNSGSMKDIDTHTLNIKGEFYVDVDFAKKLIENNKVVITQGFIASTSDNKFCVLTRSGSNTSASLIASAINADRLEIWTDVDGLYTADPRKITSAKMIEFIKYEVCQEAAAMGSQIIHPFSIKPCEEKHIPIHIHNTFNVDAEKYTVINGNVKGDTDNIHLISYQGNVTLFQIKSDDMWDAYGIASDILKCFAENKIDVNIITTSQFTVAVTTNEKSEIKLQKIYNKYIEMYGELGVKITRKCAIVSIIADNISHNPYIHDAYKVISEISEPIYIIHNGATNLTLSFVVNETYADYLTKKLHDKLIN